MKNFLALFLIALLPMSVAAAPSITKNIEYYDVKGWDAAFIKNEMNAKGPRDMNSGNRVWAHTHWKVRWNFEYAEESLSCEINRVATSVTVNFVVPKWIERDKAPQLVRDKWDNFYTTLQKHEQQHAMHGVQAARDIENQIASLPAKRTCKQAKEAANIAAKAIIKKYSDMDIAYDSKTDHGRTEGVVF